MELRGRLGGSLLSHLTPDLTQELYIDQLRSLFATNFSIQQVSEPESPPACRTRAGVDSSMKAVKSKVSRSQIRLALNAPIQAIGDEAKRVPVNPDPGHSNR
jgi:hypothetical protein